MAVKTPKDRTSVSTSSHKGRSVISLAIDRRWNGNHGIARYGREVLSRLTIDSTPLAASARPGSPLDLLLPRRAQGATAIYSPGYNAGIARIPQYVTVHDLIHLAHAGSRHRGYYENILKPAIRAAGTVFTVSETSADALREWLGDDSIDVVNTGNGCSASFRPKGESRSLSLPYVLYVGNLKPHKNFEVIPAALSRTRDVGLVVITSDVDEAKSMAERYGVSDRTHYIDGASDEELASWYRGAEATIVPSKLEGFGLPALESLSSGTPVIYWAGCRSVAEICGTDGLAVEDADCVDGWLDAVQDAVDGLLADRKSVV